MQKWLVVGVLVLGVVEAGVLCRGWFAGDGAAVPAPDILLQKALRTPTDEAAERAALQLAQAGPAAAPQLRRLAREAADPQLQAIGLQGLGQAKDWDGMPAVLEALVSPDEIVRGRALTAAGQILGRNYAPVQHRRPDAWAAQVELVRRHYEASRRPATP